MEIQELVNEQLIRKVAPTGNGAHIFAPRDWLGEEVIIVRTPKLSLKERILNVLKPYLEEIRGVYLYGSYARGESEKDSDIDILIITNKKIKIKKRGYEIISLNEDLVAKAIKISPILIYSALSEAKPIINSKLLEELKEKHPIKIRHFKEYIKETKKMIEINKELLDSYSIILRLRGVFITNQFLSKDIYSHKKFKSWILNSLPEIDYDSIYYKYKKTKNESTSQKHKISKLNEKDLKSLLSLLREKVDELEETLNGKKRKKA